MWQWKRKDYTDARGISEVELIDAELMQEERETELFHVK